MTPAENDARLRELTTLVNRLADGKGDGPGASSSLEEAFWQLADEPRGKTAISPVNMLRLVEKEGIPVTWREAHLPIFTQHGRVPIRPEIIEFIREYLDQRPVSRVIDPSVYAGSLLAGVVDADADRSGVGIVRDKHALEVSERIGGDRVTWIHGDPEQVIPTLEGAFDLLVSFPRLGESRSRWTLEIRGESVQVRDSQQYASILKAVGHLKPDGEVILIVPNPFFSPRPKGFIAALGRIGLHLNAVIALPERALMPATSVSVNLGFFRPRAVDQLFVGRLIEGGNSAALLKNLRERRAGRVPELGRLVAPREFRCFQQIADREEVERLAAKSGFRPHDFAELTVAINLARQNPASEFDEIPNSVYLPIIGTSPAVTSPAEMQIKPASYIQLVLDPDQANAEFVARMFNTDLGRKLRGSLLSGGMIPKISKSTLAEDKIYLPPPKIQERTIEVEQEIRSLSLQLDDLARELWDRPVRADEVLQRVKNVNREDSFETWVQSLPFPLASILWRYHAEHDPGLRRSHLFNFFEATAEFFTTVLLSGYYSDREFFLANKREFSDADPDAAKYLLKASFGSWIVLGERLAKFTRKLLSDNSSREICLALFRTRRDDLVTTLSHKEVYRILKRVNDYRNSWKGHGGVESPREHERQLRELEVALTEMREGFRAAFADYVLLKPGRSSYRSGLYDYTAESLMGRDTIFKKVTVQTLSPMDEERLYLLDTNELQPLELVPLFRMHESPPAEENACYFFNRVDKEGVRFVSYHFAQESAVHLEAPGILTVIKELTT